MIDLAPYEHRGNPADDVPLTPRDHRRQREAVALLEYAQITMRDNPPPPLPPRTVELIRTILSRPTPPTELMRWSLRLSAATSSTGVPIAAT